MNHLYRGKRKDKPHEWVEGNLVYVRDGETGKTYPNIVISYNHDTFDWIDVIPESVGMASPFTDKNGRRIFSGDKLKALHKEQGTDVGAYEVEDTVMFRNGSFVCFGKSFYESFAPSNILTHFMWSEHWGNIQKQMFFELVNIEITNSIHD